MSGWIYELKDLRKDYDEGQVQALRGIDLCVREGEFLAIIGASGSGKSTLLQMLGALDQPSAGRIDYRGQSMAALPSPARYRASEIGFVFQAFHLLPSFTAIENVEIPMFESERNSRQRRERAGQLLEQVGMTHRRNHLPSKLSGGERQRIAIARSLANEPKVLLADEPTGNLDSENAHFILDLLANLHAERGMTLILVTHDNEIAARASRRVKVQDGRIVSDDGGGTVHS